MARAKNRVRARLHHISKDNLIHFAGIDARTANGFLRRQRAELDRRNILESTHIPCHRCACSRHDHNIGWKHSPSFDRYWSAEKKQD